MSTKTKVVVGVVVILIATIVAGVFLLRGKNELNGNENSKNPNLSSSTASGNIVTSKFGFQVPMPANWRLAKLINPFVDSKIKINDKYASEAANALSEAEISNFNQKHSQELAGMTKTWMPQNSEMIIITKMTNDEEKKLYDNPGALLDNNLEKVVNVTVKDVVADPKTMKEENNDKKITKIFNLEDGSPAFYLNIISMKKRIVQIPMQSKEMLVNGKAVGGLFIETSESAMSQDDFIGWTKKIKINLPQ